MKYLTAAVLALVPAAVVAVWTWPTEGDDDPKLATLVGAAFVYLLSYFTVEALWNAGVFVTRRIRQRREA